MTRVFFFHVKLQGGWDTLLELSKCSTNTKKIDKVHCLTILELEQKLSEIQ